MNTKQKIIHVDMDAFFASVEQRDNPAFRGKPLVVGSPHRRGVISAASYEARKFGIHSAMPSLVAMKKCPDLIFARGRFDVYKSVSEQIRVVFAEYTDIVEPLSLDEAFLDVTQNKMNNPSATRIAQEIRAKIYQRTHLTASAGVSFNKFLAKVASAWKKPDGLTVIAPKDAPAFIEQLPVRKIPGCGKVTQSKMYANGIITCGDLLLLSRDRLEMLFGKAGLYFYNVIRNEYYDPVRTEYERKSLSAERTYIEDLTDNAKAFEQLELISKTIGGRMNKADIAGKTITLKVRYNDFSTFTRSRTMNHAFNYEKDIFDFACELFEGQPIIKPIRLLGIQISNLIEDINLTNGVQLVIDYRNYEKDLIIINDKL
jgi:DNA polymerase-4